MKTEELTQLVIDALEELKAVNLHVIDVREKTSITDVMVPFLKDPIQAPNIGLSLLGCWYFVTALPNT